METFIKLLPLEMSTVTEYVEPDMALGKGDHEVGEMSADERKLWTLYRNAAKEMALMAVERKFGRIEDTETWAARYDEMSDRAHILNRLFWMAVKSEHSLWGKEGIGVRQGFLVVWCEPRNRPPGFGGLIDLLGLGGGEE